MKACHATLTSDWDSTSHHRPVILSGAAFQAERRISFISGPSREPEHAA